jgi:hypothetical protein
MWSQFDGVLHCIALGVIATTPTDPPEHKQGQTQRPALAPAFLYLNVGVCQHTLTFAAPTLMSYIARLSVMSKSGDS